jgi:hypothetical protein
MAALIGGGAMAAVAAEHPDAELLAACAAYQRLHVEWMGPYVSELHTDDLGTARQTALVRVSELHPTTPEGRQAKAGVAYSALMFVVDAFTTIPWRENASAEEEIALDVLHDFMGRA